MYSDKKLMHPMLLSGGCGDDELLNSNSESIGILIVRDVDLLAFYSATSSIVSLGYIFEALEL
jgi:hypothetical protein